MLMGWVPLALLAAGPVDTAGACVCPNASFGPAPRAYPTGPIASDVGTIADVTGDGQLDLVLATRSFTGVVTTLAGDGRGGLGAPIRSEIGQGGDRAIAVADLDADGRPDVLLAGGQANPFVAAALGDGAGAFALSWNAFLGSEPSSIATGDFDADGQVDLAVSATGSGRLAVLHGLGNGTFATPSLLPSVFGVTDVLAADWNQDTRTDLAYLEPVAGSIVVRFGDGAGGFGSPQSLDAGGGPRDLKTADLDGDGRLDFVVYRPNAQAFSVVRGLVGGTFAPRTDHPTALDDVGSYALGDLDADGRADLVLSQTFFLAGHLSVMRGAPGPTFLAPVRAVLGAVGQVHLADFDQDGRLDAGVVAGRSAFVAWGRGDATFDQPTRVATNGEPRRLAVAPMNADARPDLIVSQPGVVSVRLNDGAGGLSAPLTVPATGAPRILRTADLDGDSDLDVLIDVNPSVAVVGLGVLLNDGQGVLTAGEVETAGIVLTAAALGDLDEDGFLDAVATDSIDPFPVLWLFRGGPNATFAAPSPFPLTGAAPNGVQVADLNGDGNLDVVVGHLFSDDVEVLLGNGSGGLAPGVRYLAPGAAGVVVADVNEDSRPDLVTGGAVLLGNGTGAFPSYSLLPVPSGMAPVLTIDVTGDGHLDLVGALDVSTVGVLRGEGTGAFHPPVQYLPVSFAIGAAVLDLDSDSRPDIVAASRYTNQVALLTNTACRPRRLELASDVAGPAGTGVPFPGQPLLEVHDDGGNRLHCATGDVTATLVGGSGAPGAQLLGDTAAGLVNGQATFADLAVDRAGQDYRLEFRHPQTSRKRSGPFDVALPRVGVADLQTAEGNAGIQLAPFHFTLSGPSGLPVEVPFATRDGSAQAGSDYQAATGTVTFPPGVTERTANVVVFGDVAPEPNELFHLELGAGTNTTVAGSPVRGRIVDDDGGGFVVSEALHGTDVVRALPPATAPRHLYLVAQQPRSSYEAVLDGTSGDLGGRDGPALRRLAADVSSVLQDSTPAGAGPARRLAWERDDQTATESEYVEVGSRGCGLDCGADDVYRLRFRETTGFIPRFNNSGGQFTVVILQNPGAAPVSGHVWFWRADGAGLAGVSFEAPPRGTVTVSTTNVPGLESASGSVTVSHDGGYGGLVGKAVSLQPGTGFSFDTPMVPRVR